MRVFRSSYRAKDGQQKQITRWCIELRDHLERQRRFSGFRDKRQSEALGRQIERLVNCRMGDGQLDAQLLHWLEAIPSRLRSRFVKCGLIEPHKAAAGRQLPELREPFTSKTPEAKAFSMPGPHKVVGMLRGDLAEADIPYVDEAGRYADFHAFRHTTGSFLAAVGVHPKVAQHILRHSKMDLTMSIYTHTLHGQESEAVAALPDLSVSTEAVQVATGTDGQPFEQKGTESLARHLARTCTGQCISMHSHAHEQEQLDSSVGAQKKALTGSRTAFLGQKRRGRDSNPR